MTLFQALTAIFRGAELCLRNRDVFRLCLRPWLVALLIYSLAAFLAISAHEPLVSSLSFEVGGFWGKVLTYLTWIGVTVFLLFASIVVTFVGVSVLSGIFQSAIAEKVLELQNTAVPQTPAGVRGLVNEAARTLGTEVSRLLWFLPLSILAVVAIFVPPLAPIAALSAAWLIAFHYFDITLDLFRIPFRKRLSFGLRHGVQMLAFGAVLTILWTIPFLGVLLSPFATAGAAWLLAQNEALSDKLAHAN